MSSIFKKVAKKVKGAASRKPTNGSPSTTPSSTPSVTNFNTYDSEETYVDYLQREIELQGNVAEVPEEEGMEGMDLGDDQVPEDEPLIQTPISGQSSSRIPPRNKGKGKAPTIEEEEEAEEEVPQAPTNTNRTKGTSSQQFNVNELSRYLDAKIDIDPNNYDILEWWRSRQHEYPIVSKIARDILAIPASTVASESAFSAGRRVLDEKRARLSPHIIQICVCKKDWDSAEDRTQGIRKDREDENDPLMLLDTDSSGGADEFDDEED